MDMDGRAAGHVACTIEMCSVTTPCEFSCGLIKIGTYHGTHLSSYQV